MLNGIDPVLIIVLKNKGILDFFGPGSLLTDALNAIGLPIPIYLSEKLTKIYVDSETRGIDVETKVDPVTAKSPLTGEVESPIVSQTSTSSQVTINMLASKDSLLLTAIIALMDMIVDRLVSGEYSIHYLNGPTVIFGALLHRFSTSIAKGEDLIRMELTLSTAAKDSPIPKAPITSIPKIAAPIPLG